MNVKESQSQHAVHGGRTSMNQHVDAGAAMSGDGFWFPPLILNSAVGQAYTIQ